MTVPLHPKLDSDLPGNFWINCRLPSSTKSLSVKNLQTIPWPIKLKARVFTTFPTPHYRYTSSLQRRPPAIHKEDNRPCNITRTPKESILPPVPFHTSLTCKIHTGTPADSYLATVITIKQCKYASISLLRRASMPNSTTKPQPRPCIAMQQRCCNVVRFG